MVLLTINLPFRLSFCLWPRVLHTCTAPTRSPGPPGQLCCSCPEWTREHSSACRSPKQTDSAPRESADQIAVCSAAGRRRTHVPAVYVCAGEVNNRQINQQWLAGRGGVRRERGFRFGNKSYVQNYMKSDSREQSSREHEKGQENETKTKRKENRTKRNESGASADGGRG